MAKKAKKKPAKKQAKKVARKPSKKPSKKPAKKPATKAAKAAEPAQPPKPKHGVFMWNELMTRDDEKAMAFFEQLLGWTHVDWPLSPENGGGTYRLMKVGETSVAGLFKMFEPNFPAQVPPHWMSYIAVDNVDARFEKALSLGAEAIHPPSDIPEVGRFCILKDPTGAAVALMTPLGGVA